MREKLIVFVEGKTERETTVTYFQDIFGDLVDVVGRSTQDHDPSEVPPIVLAGESTMNVAGEYYPNSQIIFISRSMSNENLEKLIMLPKGTKVIIANYPRSATMETIHHLETMGITHLDITPYWPGITDYDKNIDIVVYVGFKVHCPPGHSQYINLGYRDVHLSIISTVIEKYDLPRTILDDVQRASALRYVDAGYKINSYFATAESSKRSFEKIFQMSENVLLITDYDDNISYVNKAAESFFEQKSSDIIGERFYKVFSDYPSLLRLYTSKDPTYQQVTAIKKTRAVVDITHLNGKPDMNVMLSIIPASEISRRDAQLRKDIKESGFHAKYTFDNILGDSQQVKEAIKLAHQYAKSNASVFIAGESGTGKELFAQSIHNLSSRSSFPFVSVNCAALPESLAESELFGYDEGAFTGASKGGKPGKFEMAHRGTIFLDEIGDAPLNLQTKLLRVIEEQEVVRIGSNKVVPIDVRIICASNRDLKKMTKEGLFRQDLYYRINVLPLQIPALRERREDIPAIATSIFDNMGMKDSKIRRYFIKELSKCSWPGNVRELRSAVQLLTTLSDISTSAAPDEINEDYWHDIFMKHFDIMPSTPAEETVPDLKYLVLKAIERKSRDGISFGRGALLKDATLMSNGLTEYRLKRYILEFSEAGLISIGSTKQGMRITEKGTATLNNYSHL